MNNYKKLNLKRNSFISIVLIFFSLKGTAQECPFKRDTVYSIGINIYQEDKWPLSTSGTIHTLNELKYPKELNNFMCEFFNNALFIYEPIFPFSGKSGCYSDTSVLKVEYDKYLQKLYDEVNPNYTDFDVDFRKDISIKILIVKIIGDFWYDKTDFKKINSLSHSYIVNKDCYPHAIYYQCKKIIKAEKITPYEIDSIKNLFHLK